MKRLVTLIIPLMAAAILYTATAQAQTVNRPVSQFFRWDGLEDATSSGPPGVTIYSHVLVNPVNPTTGVARFNVGYLRMAITGDEHSGASALFGCFINGVPCNPGTASASTGAPGFVNLGKTGEDNHDNSETYHWCFPLPGGTNTIALNLASDNTGVVFVQGAYIDLEAAKIPAAGACTMAP